MSVRSSPIAACRHGEQHLSYASQIGVIAFLTSVSTATGIACLAAVIRGLRGESSLGDFYLDMSRATTLVLIPYALILAMLLVATGVPMTWQGTVTSRSLEGPPQSTREARPPRWCR